MMNEAPPSQLPLPGFADEEIKDPDKKMERDQKLYIKKIVEALLFASNEPLPVQKMRDILGLKIMFKPKLLRDALKDLQDDYIRQQRAFRLEETLEGYILKTCEEYAPFIDQLYRNKRAEKVSPASAEVLAIVAYKQPITKSQIDAIRGVDCSGILQNLAERGLIHSLGKQETPGRPTLYGITSHFLTHFGLRDLSELPKVKC